MAASEEIVDFLFGLLFVFWKTAPTTVFSDGFLIKVFQDYRYLDVKSIASRFGLHPK